MLLVSVVKGAVRDFTYGRYMKKLTAHQRSTVSSIHVFPPEPPFVNHPASETIG